MRHQADTKEDSPARVGASTPWKVTEVRLLSGYRLFVRFADGIDGEVDLSKLIGGPTPDVFECLRDPARFAEVKIDGGAVSWPGDLDLAPDAMHDEINSKGSWTPD